MNRLLIVIAFSLAFLPCFAAQSPAWHEDVWMYEPPKNVPADHTIQAKSGEVFLIVLKANPTTGYVWELSFDPEYVQLLSRKYVYTDTGKGKDFGKGCDEIFEFKALNPGQTKITFSQYRRWLKNEPPVGKKTFIVDIK